MLDMTASSSDEETVDGNGKAKHEKQTEVKRNRRMFVSIGAIVADFSLIQVHIVVPKIVIKYPCLRTVLRQWKAIFCYKIKIQCTNQISKNHLSSNGHMRVLLCDVIKCTPQSLTAALKLHKIKITNFAKKQWSPQNKVLTSLNTQ